MKNVILLSLLCAPTTLLAQADVTTQGLVELKEDIKTIQKRVEVLEKKVATLDATGKTQEIALTKTHLSNEELLHWVTDKIIEIYSYNYINYQQVLQNIRPYFTKDGYLSYMKALEESKNLEAIKNKKMIVYAQVSEIAKIVHQGVEGDIYRWEVAVPLLVQYSAGEKEIKQQTLVTLELVRMPYKESKIGLAIHAITASLVKEEPKKEISAPTPANKGKEDKVQSPLPSTVPLAPSH